MGFPIRRLFVVSVALFYIYMGVCTVTPAINADLHSELVSTHFTLLVEVYLFIFHIELKVLT